MAVSSDKQYSRAKEEFCILGHLTLHEFQQKYLRYSSKMVAQTVDKHGNPIHEGDYVFTRIRGGSHEGKVSGTRRLI